VEQLIAIITEIAAQLAHFGGKNNFCATKTTIRIIRRELASNSSKKSKCDDSGTVNELNLKIFVLWVTICRKRISIDSGWNK
jgi:hypothetical protein